MESGENNQPLLHGHVLQSRISDLSSTAIEELLEQPPPTVPALQRLARLLAWESRLIFHVASSSIIAGIFNNLLGFVTLTLCSQLSVVELAGASIANLVIQGLANGIMQVLCQLCARKPMDRAKQYAALGIMCQRAIIILHLVAAVPLTFLCWWSSPILVAMGVSEIIADQGQLFSSGIIPQLYALAINYPQQRFLQSQNLVNPLALIAVVIFVLHFVCTWLVLNVYHYGVMGAALMLSFSWWLLVLFCGIYIGFSSKCKETWTGFSWKAFKGMCTSPEGE